MQAKVWRNGDGVPVHIGEWDYGRYQVPNPDYDALIAARDARVQVAADEGRKLTVDDDPLPPAMLEIVGNPLPDGLSEALETVVKLEDGGRAVASDYVSLRRGAYPSVTDQLDAFWKGGEAAEAMREQVLAVKAKYPKFNQGE